MKEFFIVFLTGLPFFMIAGLIAYWVIEYVQAARATRDSSVQQPFEDSFYDSQV